MNPITSELIRRIAATIPENNDKPLHDGPCIIDNGPSKELDAFLNSGDENILREIKKVIDLIE